MEEEWIGKFYGVSARNSINVTFQSKTHPGMIYEYNLQRRHKKNPDVGIFRCSGCRSENSKAKNAELPVIPKVTYVTGRICESKRIVKFHSDPDESDHCCWRRTPHHVKGKKIRREVRNKVRQSGLTGGECLDMLYDTVLENDKNDADFVLPETGTSESTKKALRRSAKPQFILNCLPADIDEELQKSAFSRCPKVVRINRPDFIFMMDEMAAVNAASTVFPNYNIKLCNWHYPKNLREYASTKCSIHLFNDDAFRKWLKTLIGASHLPLPWMEQLVDHLLSHPPTIHQALMIHFNKFVEYYRRQWRQKLKLINYFDTVGPRTTNACEAFNSSLNTLIPQRKMTFRLCFMAYKKALKSAVCDFLQSHGGAKLKIREKRYRLAESRYIRRKNAMNVLFEAHQNPGIQELMLYSIKQAYCTTEDFPAAVADRRFDIQDQPVQQPNPRPQQQPINQQQQFVHPFFGVQNFVEVQQMLHQPLRPQFYQHPQNLIRFHQPRNQRFNLNMSLPVQYQQFQQFPPQFYYNQRPPF